MAIDIIEASYNDDLVSLKLCIADKQDVNVKDDSGFSPLHWICFMGVVGNNHVEMAGLLIQSGADVNSCLPNDGPSILESACESGNSELVKLLIQNGADINYRGDGETPLIHAVRSGVIESVSLLIENGADYKISNELGQMPKDVANNYERSDMVELFDMFEMKH